MIDKAVKDEIGKIWDGRKEEGGRKRIKDRLIPNGNKDRMNDTVSMDSATGGLDIIRLILSVEAMRRLRLGCFYFKDAYLERGHITRYTCFNPRKQL